MSRFQKQIFLFLFEPKNEENYFLNSALVSKMFQIKQNEGTLLYQLGGIQGIIYYLTHFRSLGQKSKNNLVRFWVHMRTRKFAFKS